MTKQQPVDWDCPHGKKWGVGCREQPCVRDGLSSGDNSYEAQSARASTGRRIPRKPGCP